MRRHGEHDDRRPPPLPVDPDLEGADSAQPGSPRRRPPGGGPSPRRLRPSVLAAIAVGGAAGTCARVAIEQALGSSPTAFPWATFLVNVTGSFVLGLVMALVLDRLPPSRLVRPLLATGVCGAYTTFSTFVTEIDLLIRAGRVPVAVLYAGASVGLGLLAVVAGLWTGRRAPIGPAQR